MIVTTLLVLDKNDPRNNEIDLIVYRSLFDLLDELIRVKIIEERIEYITNITLIQKILPFKNKEQTKKPTMQRLIWYVHDSNLPESIRNYSFQRMSRFFKVTNKESIKITLDLLNNCPFYIPVNEQTLFFYMT